MLVSSEITTWHLRCLNSHFDNEEDKQDYLNDFKIFLKKLAKNAGDQAARFEVDDAENCEHDDKNPPAVRVRLRLSAKPRTVRPEDAFREAVSSFCSQIFSNITHRDMKQTISRVTNYGLMGILPISHTFRLHYARVWLQGLLTKNIPSLHGVLGSQTDFWPDFFKGVFLGVVVLFETYNSATTDSEGEKNTETKVTKEHLGRMATEIWERLTAFCTLKAEETPKEVQRKTDRLLKELAEESKTYNILLERFKIAEEKSALCVDPSLSTDILDSTLRMFDTTFELITANQDMLTHFRKVCGSYRHNRNVCVGVAATGGIVAIATFLSGATALLVAVPVVACSPVIILAGCHQWQARNAEAEQMKLERQKNLVHNICVCSRNIATFLLPVTEVELGDEDPEIPRVKSGPQNGDGNVEVNNNIKAFMRFCIDVSKKKMVLTGTHLQKFRTVLYEEGESQIQKDIEDLIKSNPAFAALRK